MRYLLLGQTHNYQDGNDYLPLELILLCNLADRPERSELTGFGYHSGEITMRWGYVWPIPENLSSCIHCWRLCASNQVKWKCLQCHYWDFLGIQIQIDKDFPKEVPEYTDGFIRSHKFCFVNALEASKYCCEKLRSN